MPNRHNVSLVEISAGGRSAGRVERGVATVCELFRLGDVQTIYRLASLTSRYYDVAKRVVRLLPV